MISVVVTLDLYTVTFDLYSVTPDLYSVTFDLYSVNMDFYRVTLCNGDHGRITFVTCNFYTVTFLTILSVL